MLPGRLVPRVVLREEGRDERTLAPRGGDGVHRTLDVDEPGLLLAVSTMPLAVARVDECRRDEREAVGRVERAQRLIEHLAAELPVAVVLDDEWVG